MTGTVSTGEPVKLSKCKNGIYVSSISGIIVIEMISDSCGSAGRNLYSFIMCGWNKCSNRDSKKTFYFITKFLKYRRRSIGFRNVFDSRKDWFGSIIIGYKELQFR